MKPTQNESTQYGATIDYDALRKWAKDRWTLDDTHGMPHWERVERNGMRIAANDVDKDVVRCFAYLHDSGRTDNGYDLEHGPRSARLAMTLRDTLLCGLTDEQMEKLLRACREHTITQRTGDITIDTCFDADRLDLPRVGITPDPHRMATVNGALAARDMNETPKTPVTGRRKKSGFSQWIAFFLFLALFVALVVTCPDREKHIEVVSESAQDYVEAQVDKIGNITGNPLIDIVMKGIGTWASGAVTDEVADYYLEKNFKLDNYVVLNIGKLKLPDGKIKTVSYGFLGKVFTFDGEKAAQQ